MIILISLESKQTFTDWNQVENARKLMAETLEASRTEEVMATIWSHLVLQKSFFEQYKNFLEGRLDVRDAESAKNALQHYDFTIFYQRFLEVVRRLSLTQRTFRIAKESYATKELVQVLLLKLAESLCQGILHHRGDKSTSRVLEFVVCPRVAVELAKERNGRSLWNDAWLDVILAQTEKSTVVDNDMLTSLKLRPVMYCFLTMIRYGEQWNSRQGDVLKVLNPLMISIDNRYSN